MTLHEYPAVEQGSEQWHALRRGLVTASVIGQLVTPKTIKPASNPEARAIFALLVSERITGWTDEHYVGTDMERGWLEEPLAIAAYSEHYAPVTTVGFMVEDKWGYKIGLSPDGLVGDDGLVEVKSRRQKKHLQTVLSGEVPPENMAQIQCALLVSGREWCDYISYSSGMHLWTRRVLPDPRWFEAIVAAVEAFEEIADVMVAAYRHATEGLPLTERVATDLEIAI